MANIVGKIGMTLKVDANPAAGAGTPAPVPTLAQFGGNLYIKTGAADTAWTQVGGSSTLAQRTVAANDTITTADDIIYVDSSGGAFNLALPDPATVKIYRVVDKTGFLNTNNVTLTRFAAENISGLAADKALTTDWGFFQISSDGVDWYIGG